MTDDLTTRYDGVLERTADGGVIRFERHLAYDVRDVWDAITTPERLADWWLPFDADITVDLREGGAMVFAGKGHGEPVTMSCTFLRVEPPSLLEHTHPAPGSTMRWELEALDTGCILRLSHHVPEVQEAIDNGYLVGLGTSLDRLEPSLAGRPEPWDWDAFRAAQAHYAALGLAAPVDGVVSSPDQQRLRVQNFMLSTDGYGTGEGQTLERPFGHADPSVLSAWAGATASWPNRTDAGGTRGLDDYFTRDFNHNIGAEIMGRGKFGPQTGPWEDLEWEGWWGDTPPFHTPVFVLTHHVRPAITLSDTTFHFIDAAPAEALQQAKAAADGKDVRLGGGVSTVREFLAADLVDAMHVVVVPVELGRGGKLWDSPDELLDRFHLERIPSPSGVTHHIFWRR